MGSHLRGGIQNDEVFCGQDLIILLSKCHNSQSSKWSVFPSFVLTPPPELSRGSEGGLWPTIQNSQCWNQPQNPREQAYLEQIIYRIYIYIHVYIFSQWFSHIRIKLPNACDTRLLSSNSMSRTSSKSEYVSRFARSRFSNPNQNTQPSSISCSTCANFSGTRLSIALETGTEFCPAAVIPTVAWGVDSV